MAVMEKLPGTIERVSGGNLISGVRDLALDTSAGVRFIASDIANDSTLRHRFLFVGGVLTGAVLTGAIIHAVHRTRNREEDTIFLPAGITIRLVAEDDDED